MSPGLRIEPLTPGLMDAMGEALRGSWGAACWCMFPRLSDKDLQALPGSGKLAGRRRAAMAKLAASPDAPGLLAFREGRPVGWIAVGPRDRYARVARSRATPPVDEVPVWIVPCVTVARPARGQGVAVALIEAAVAYAASRGAPAVEAYPRAGDARTGDDNAYYGTEPMFRRAGFRIVRPRLDGTPRNWTPRVAMRIDTTQQET